ncbi:MAG: type II toxin-antitoxin system HicA family toxin [Syntrophothermaceae bacterium]
MVKLLIFLGFIQIRQKGSHIFFAHPDGRTTVVPCHNDDHLPFCGNAFMLSIVYG